MPATNIRIGGFFAEQQKTCQKLRQQVEEHQEQQKRLSGEKQHLEESNQVLEIERNGYKEQLEDLQAMIRDLSAENSQLARDRENLLETTDTQAQQLKLVRQDRESTSEQLSAAKNDIETLSKQLQETTKQLSNLKIEHMVLRESTGVALKTEHATAVELHQVVDDQTGNLVLLQSVLNDRNKTIKALRNDKQKLFQQLTATRIALRGPPASSRKKTTSTGAAGNNSLLLSRVSSLKQQLDIERKEKIILQEELTVVRRQQQNLTIRFREASHGRKRLEDKVKELQLL